MKIDVAVRCWIAKYDYVEFVNVVHERIQYSTTTVLTMYFICDSKTSDY